MHSAACWPSLSSHSSTLPTPWLRHRRLRVRWYCDGYDTAASQLGALLRYPSPPAYGAAVLPLLCVAGQSRPEDSSKFMLMNALLLETLQLRTQNTHKCTWRRAARLRSAARNSSSFLFFSDSVQRCGHTAVQVSPWSKVTSNILFWSPYLFVPTISHRSNIKYFQQDNDKQAPLRPIPAKRDTDVPFAPAKRHVNESQPLLLQPL